MAPKNEGEQVVYLHWTTLEMRMHPARVCRLPVSAHGTAENYSLQLAAKTFLQHSFVITYPLSPTPHSVTQ